MQKSTTMYYIHPLSGVEIQWLLSFLDSTYKCGSQHILTYLLSGVDRSSMVDQWFGFRIIDVKNPHIHFLFSAEILGGCQVA